MPQESWKVAVLLFWRGVLNAGSADLGQLLTRVYSMLRSSPAPAAASPAQVMELPRLPSVVFALLLLVLLLFALKGAHVWMDQWLII
jgi:hypothetical protein